VPGNPMTHRRGGTGGPDVDPYAYVPPGSGLANLGPVSKGPRRSGSITARSGGSGRFAVTALNLLAGSWLVVAPSVLDYNNTVPGFGVAWNDVAVGIAIALVAVARMVDPFRGAALAAVSFVLGTWLAAAPFVLAAHEKTHAGAAMWNDLVVGVVVAVLALVSAELFRPRGRWTSAVRP
jgi:SPW repeat